MHLEMKRMDDQPAQGRFAGETCLNGNSLDFKHSPGLRDQQNIIE